MLLINLEKIFIVTTDKTELNTAYKIATRISREFGLDVAKTFISDLNLPICKDIPEYFTYFDVNDMVIAFKNNAMLYCVTESEKSMGISIDDFYNTDIFCMSVEAFNNIADSMLLNMLIIWIDAKTTNTTDDDQFNVKILLNTLDSIPYMYFNESTRIIKQTICEYIEATPTRRQEILDENS